MEVRQEKKQEINRSKLGKEKGKKMEVKQERVTGKIMEVKQETKKGKMERVGRER